MQGEVVYFYAFDVANEISTAGVREILGQTPTPLDIRSDSTYPKDVPLYKPLSISLPALEAKLGGPVRIVIHVFDVGVVNVSMRVAFDVPALADLIPYHNPLLAGGESFDQAAQRICVDVCRSLRNHLVRGADPTLPEAYTIFCLTELGAETDASAWCLRERRHVAGLLTETPAERLSDAQVDETLRINRSFARGDLAIIDWDASLVIDSDGYVEDVLYVLELANLQLEEFRVMDRRLDRYLERAYEDVERRRFPIFGGSNRITRSLRRLRMDVAKLTDEVTHITKFLGDWHLARIYLGARDRFYLDQWRQSVEQRIGQLDELYRVLHAETSELRMLWLEIAIVVLFVIDVAALFLWKK